MLGIILVEISMNQCPLSFGMSISKPPVGNYSQSRNDKCIDEVKMFRYTRPLVPGEWF